MEKYKYRYLQTRRARFCLEYRARSTGIISRGEKKNSRCAKLAKGSQSIVNESAALQLRGGNTLPNNEEGARQSHHKVKPVSPPGVPFLVHRLCLFSMDKKEM